VPGIASLASSLWVTAPGLAQIAGETREGALCSGLVTKAREGKTLTDDEQAYLQNWCRIKNPHVWDAEDPPLL